MERSGSTGNGTGSTRNSTGNSTGSGSRNTGRNTGNGPGNSTGSGPRNTGNGTGNGSGSGRAAPPGGPGRALLCLALLLLLPPARALPSPARTLPSACRTLPTVPRQPLAPCLNRSLEQLLEETNASLHRLKERDVLGFNCTFEEVDLADITKDQINTIRACTAEDPGPGNCPVLDRSTFDEGKCLQGISEDLRTYRSHLRNLEDAQLLVALDELMKALGNCSRKDPEATPGSGASGSALGSPGSSSGSSSGSSLGSSSGSSLGSPGSSGSPESSGSPSVSPGSSLGSSLGSSPGSPGLASLRFSERLRLCGALLAFRLRSITISRMLSFLSSL